jgi:exosortase/archaeosortase family protein
MNKAPASWTFPVSRRQLFFGVFVLGFANVLVDKAVRSVATLGLAPSIGELFQVSAIVFAAIAAALILLGKGAASRPATTRDSIVAVVVALCTLPPVGLLSRIAVAGAALYLLCSSPRWSAEWRAAAIAASTSAYFLIGPALLTIYLRDLEFIDAWLVAKVTGLEHQGGLVAMSGQAGWVIIRAPCSSMHALSLSAILPVTYSQWVGIDDWRRIAAVCLTTALATVACNVARLSALVEWPAYFDVIHVGWGSTVIATATLLAMLAISFVGFEHARQ